MPAQDEEVIAEDAIEETTEETPDPEATEEDSGIEIDGQKFKTEALALEYARNKTISLEVEVAKADAYRQGILEARQDVTNPKNVTAPAEQEDDPEWETKFYENPKKVMAEAMAKAAEIGKKEALRTVGIQSEDVRLWNKFTDLNPDLADFKRDVEMMGDEHKELIMSIAKTKGEDEAIKFLGQKTRAKFQQFNEKAKPSKELPNKGGGVSPSGGADKVTNSKDKKTSDKPLSFVEQMKQNKRRHA